MLKNIALLTLLLAVTMVLPSGCNREEPRSAEPVLAEVASPAPEEATPKKRTRVVVPAEVRGKWQAVKIAVRDKEGDREEVYTVPVGSEVAIPGSELVVQVKVFLPAFIMDGAVMTSASNELKNPGAQVVVTEKGLEVFRGWLFSLYPGAHAFQHPRYNFTLVDFVPVPRGKVFEEKTGKKG